MDPKRPGNLPNADERNRLTGAPVQDKGRIFEVHRQARRPKPAEHAILDPRSRPQPRILRYHPRDNRNFATGEAGTAIVKTITVAPELSLPSGFHSVLKIRWVMR